MKYGKDMVLPDASSQNETKVRYDPCHIISHGRGGGDIRCDFNRKLIDH